MDILSRPSSLNTEKPTTHITGHSNKTKNQEEHQNTTKQDKSKETQTALQLNPAQTHTHQTVNETQKPISVLKVELKTPN